MSRDKEAFKVFFEQQFEPLRRLAYRLTGDWSEADDLAQEAMVRTYRAWGRAQRPELYARAALINKHRSGLRRLLVERRHAPAPPVAHVSFDAEALVVWEEVLALPWRQRAAVVLHYYEDMPQTEIAGVLGCSSGTVNSLVYRGLEKLRARLAPEGVTFDEHR